LPSIGADRHRSPLPLQAAAAQEKAANAEATSAREAAAKAAAATASTSRELSALRAKFKAQSAELTRLVGHQNPNQKIQLHNRIKTENNELREELNARGFSEAFIRRFFEPFFGGVFLERSLDTSA
jgi:hypothetical protein